MATSSGKQRQTRFPSTTDDSQQWWTTITTADKITTDKITINNGWWCYKA